MKCVMYDECPFNTETCTVAEPDEGCYPYRYFEKLINKKQRQKDILNEKLIYETKNLIEKLEKYKLQALSVPHVTVESEVILKAIEVLKEMGI